MPPVDPKTYWRSLEELGDTEAFRRHEDNEFAELLPEDLPAGSRRRFLQLMGASLALAGVSGCVPHPNNPTWPRWPKTKILPHAYRPDGTDPGKPQYYATTFEMNGVAKPVLAKSYDGRPIKIEGNPEHPASRGGADAFAQASVLGMYDPTRSTGPARMSGGETAAPWSDFLGDARQVLRVAERNGGENLRILAEASSSPSLARVRAEWQQRFPRMKWYEWEPVSRDAERDGTRLAFGRPMRPLYALDRAQVIVSLEDDFLGEHPNAMVHTRDFAHARNPDGAHMCRLFAVESFFSLTGSNADSRHPVPSGAVTQVAFAVAAALANEHHVELPAELSPVLSAAAQHGAHHPFVSRLAEELAGARGQGLICAGPSQPASVHALVAALNVALGNAGTTVSYAADPAGDRAGHVASIRELARDMGAGQVKALFLLGGNPVFDAPADVEFGDALPHVEFSAHLSPYRDETSQKCKWHLPRAHTFEAWSDSRSWDGTWTFAQPIIEPLYEGRTPAELLASLAADRAVTGRELVEATFTAAGAGNWRASVHDGFVKGSAYATSVPALAGSWRPTTADFTWTEPSAGACEVVFRPDAKIWDGRFYSNPWLQELPDPMTKLTWDNAALVDPATARDLGVGMGDMIRLTAGNHTVDVPVYLMPGQARRSIALPLGYGRGFSRRMSERGREGKQGGGFDVYPFRGSETPWRVASATVARTGGHYALVTTQDHHAIPNVDNAMQASGQAQRLPELYREASLEDYKHHPEFAKHKVHHPPLVSLWTEHDYETGHKWGMAIDLSACTGCSACVIACQAENNIQPVGKKEVSHGREMHWIRVDRYFSGDIENPKVAHQPITCHQCENAPCEQVCPVAATIHSAEGLNDMVYNRCVGTRYCSNNCPYKVRRFNYFNNTRHLPAVMKMAQNPDVTVRSRGVMEKCTYCVQRIKAVTIPARNDRRAVRDGEIVPACAQSCPAEAIVFGDLNDPKSRVRKAHDHDRAYAMLAELNVKPRTRFLAKVRNPGGGAGHGVDHGNDHGADHGGGHAASTAAASTGVNG
ncbi:MAG: TAT-variant-translocated molybdopterin oxidoreductase [bacterium]